MMKNDGMKVVMWRGEHKTVARCVCVCIAIMGIVLASMGAMTAMAAVAASALGIGYVLLLTKRYLSSNEQ